MNSLRLRKLVQTALDTVDRIREPVPDDVRAARGLVDRAVALELVHRPAVDDQPARGLDRLKYDEAFVLQTILAQRRKAAESELATPRPPRPGGLLAAFDARLPFELTAGQREIGEVLAAELASDRPMHRLLQGEVGSGKTVVALRAMLAAIDAGGQAALLAPTEVLAAQHHRSITAMLGDLAQGGMLGGSEFGTTVALLTGSQNAGTRRRSLLDAASGEAGIVVGTHALIQKHVQFADLALVVVDEQHRFGVEQRDALREKGIRPPHVLVMTATPIPRTVAMTVFGDMETSTLRELPRGRSPITTHVVDADKPGWVDRTWQRVAEEVAKGHQAYVVCPRIGDVDDETALASGGAASSRDTSDEDAGWDAHWEGDDGDAEGDAPARELTGVYAMLSTLRANPALDGLRIGVLHGRLDPDAKDATMRAFADGEIDVLVATTVIEVGVDVPNASVMVVVDADRFGISQLHQLRGRVGRGAVPGLCLLMTQGAGSVPPSASTRSPRRPTASSWPAPTCCCAARATCSGRGRAAAATPCVTCASAGSRTSRSSPTPARTPSRSSTPTPGCASTRRSRPPSRCASTRSRPYGSSGADMTRIISGTAGGRRLQTPPGSSTRPTSDRVREALFSRLEHRGLLEGACVLDLYAGSGALGLEAASRGAAQVLLVESHQAAAKVIRANVGVIGHPGVRRPRRHRRARPRRRATRRRPHGPRAGRPALRRVRGRPGGRARRARRAPVARARRVRRRRALEPVTAADVARGARAVGREALRRDRRCGSPSRRRARSSRDAWREARAAGPGGRLAA